MKIITLKECKDLFPVGSFGSYRMAIHEDDYADDLVLLIEEDCTIENLDLDDVSSTFPLVQKKPIHQHYFVFRKLYCQQYL